MKKIVYVGQALALSASGGDPFWRDVTCEREDADEASLELSESFYNLKPGERVKVRFIKREWVATDFVVNEAEIT